MIYLFIVLIACTGRTHRIEQQLQQVKAYNEIEKLFFHFEQITTNDILFGYSNINNKY